MQANELAGKVLTGVWFDAVKVHPAWIDQDTPDITTHFVNLEFSESEACIVFPCEIEISKEQYPSLGIELESISHAANLTEYTDGSLRAVQRFEENSLALPQNIEAVVESDPIEEGVLSQITLVLANGANLNIFHTMPPITLGLTVSNV
jgi:hypothetical protein